LHCLHGLAAAAGAVASSNETTDRQLNPTWADSLRARSSVARVTPALSARFYDELYF